MQVYISRDGQQIGPYNEEQLTEKLQTREVSYDDLGWVDGMAGWLPLRQFVTEPVGGKAPPLIPHNKSAISVPPEPEFQWTPTICTYAIIGGLGLIVLVVGIILLLLHVAPSVISIAALVASIVCPPLFLRSTLSPFTKKTWLPLCTSCVFNYCLGYIIIYLICSEERIWVGYEFEYVVFIRLFIAFIMPIFTGLINYVITNFLSAKADENIPVNLSFGSVANGLYSYGGTTYCISNLSSVSVDTRTVVTKLSIVAWLYFCVAGLLAGVALYLQHDLWPVAWWLPGAIWGVVCIIAAPFFSALEMEVYGLVLVGQFGKKRVFECADPK